MKLKLTLILFLLIHVSLHSKVPDIGFEKVEDYINSKNDTLYIINFWATWCKPCIEELPYFEEIQEKFSDQKVQVVLFSLDIPRHLESRVIPFVKKHQIKSRVYLLSEGNENVWIPKVDPKWTGAIPATLFIRNNKERGFYEKEFKREELLQIVNQFLNN